MPKVLDLFLKLVGAFFLILVLIPFLLLGLGFLFVILLRAFPLILLLLFILAIIFYFIKRDNTDKSNLSQNMSNDSENENLNFNSKKSFYRKKVIKSFSKTDTSSNSNDSFYRETTVEFNKTVGDFDINEKFPNINEILSNMNINLSNTSRDFYTEKIIENLNSILAKTDNIKQKEELTKSVNNILHYLTELEKVKNKIPKFEKYEINKLIQQHLLKILSLGSKSDKSSIDKVIQGVKIIENEIGDLYTSYIGNVEDQLDKEIEFLKRKYED